MTKAEQRALAYAKTHSHLGYDYDQTFDAVKYGYLQAEKDLAMTPEDVVVITTLYDCGKTRGWTIEEVLKRFNEQRKK